jgi:hypothetical protein
MEPSWKDNTVQERVTPIANWIVRLGIAVGRLFGGRKAEPSPNGNPVRGRLTAKEIHRALLLRTMRDLSEQYYTAGWIIGLEFYLWHTATTKPHTEEGQTLMFLAEASGGWWMWDDGKGGPLFVPLPIWTEQYQQHGNEILEPAA